MAGPPLRSGFVPTLRPSMASGPGRSRSVLTPGRCWLTSCRPSRAQRLPPWRGVRTPGAGWESKGYPYISIMETPAGVQPSAARCRLLSQAQGLATRWPLDPCVSRAYPMHMPCIEVHGTKDLWVVVESVLSLVTHPARPQPSGPGAPPLRKPPCPNA